MYFILLLGIILITVATLGAVWTSTEPYHQIDPVTGVCRDCGCDTLGGQQ